MKRKQRIRPSKALGLLIATSFLVGSPLAFAAETPSTTEHVTPSGETDTSVRTAANGADIVDIANPNNAGLSNNLYIDFNVGDKGLVLNNSLAGAQTSTAGWVDGNAHLNQTAHLIVNEVTSDHVTTMGGALEVGGNRADVLVANPSGIRVEGGSFINVGNATLTTGRPEYEASGALKEVRVERGNVTVNGELDARGTDRLNVLARAVKINDAIRANEARVVTGANIIDATTSAVTPIVTENKSGFALDVASVGGMYAGKILLVGTESGVGVNQSGTLSADDIAIDEAGNIYHTGSIAAKNLAITSKDSVTVKAGTLQGENSLQVKADGNIDIAGVVNTASDSSNTYAMVAKRVSENRFSESAKSVFRGATVTGGDTLLTAGGDVNFTGTAVKADALAISAGKNLTMDAGLTTYSEKSVVNQSKGSWHHCVTDATEKTSATVTTADVKNNLALYAGGDVNLYGATLHAKDIAAEAKGAFSAENVKTTDVTEQHIDIAKEGAGLLTGKTDIIKKTDTLYKGSLQSEGSLSLKGAAVVLTGVEVTGKDIGIEAGSLKVAADTTSSTVSDHAAYKRWGGIAGKDSHIVDTADRTSVGANVAGDTVTLNVAGSTDIIGSRLVGTHRASLVSGSALSIREAIERSEARSFDRTGTAFNITKAQTLNASTTDSVKESSVESTTNLSVETGDFTLSGSKLSGGDSVSVDAMNIEMKAAQGSQTTVKESFGWEKNAKVDIDLENKKATVTASLGTVKTAESKTENNLAAAQITGRDVALTGENAKLFGTKVAGDTVSLSGGTVTIGDAKTDSQTVTKERKGSATFSVGYNNGAWSAGIAGSGEGTTDTKNASTSVASEFTGGKITVQGDSVTDIGTKYAGSSVSIEAKGDYTAKAAADTTSEEMTTGGASLSLSGTTSNGASFSLTGTVSANGASMKAAASKERATQLSADEVSITSGGKLDGTFVITGKNVALSGSEVHLGTTVEESESKNVSGSGSLTVSGTVTTAGTATVDSFGVSGKGIYEHATNHRETGSTISSGNLSVVSTGDITGEGTKLTADKLEIRAEGNITFDVAEAKQTNVAVNGEGSLSGGVKDGTVSINKLPLSGSGSVLVQRKEGETLSSISGGSVALQAGGDVALSSNVKGNTTSLQAGGDVTLDGATSKEFGLKVAGAVDVSGTPVKLTGKETKDDLKKIVKDDWDNNKTFGLTIGKTGGEVAYKNKKETTKAEIAGDTLTLASGTGTPVVYATTIETNGLTPVFTQGDLTADYNHDFGLKLYVTNPTLKNFAEAVKAGDWLKGGTSAFPVEADAHLTWE